MKANLFVVSIKSHTQNSNYTAKLHKTFRTDNRGSSDSELVKNPSKNHKEHHKEPELCDHSGHNFKGMKENTILTLDLSL